MKKSEQISSTEKLLDLIKGNQTPDSDLFDTMVSNKRRNFLFKRHRTVVGVVPGFKDITFVMIKSVNLADFELVKFKKIPIDQNIKKESSKYPSILKKAISSFVGNEKKTELWCTIPSDNVETHLIQIPKVQKKQISSTVFWVYKKEKPFDESKFIFDYN